jgi:hypothetical protein
MITTPRPPNSVSAGAPAAGYAGAAAANARHCALAVFTSRRGMRRPAATKSTSGRPPKPRMPGGNTTDKPPASCAADVSAAAHRGLRGSVPHHIRCIQRAPQRARGVRLTAAERRGRNRRPVAATRVRCLRWQLVATPQRVLAPGRPTPPPLVLAGSLARKGRHASCTARAQRSARFVRRQRGAARASLELGLQAFAAKQRHLRHVQPLVRTLAVAWGRARTVSAPSACAKERALGRNGAAPDMRLSDGRTSASQGRSSSGLRDEYCVPHTVARQATHTPRPLSAVVARGPVPGARRSICRSASAAPHASSALAAVCCARGARQRACERACCACRRGAPSGGATLASAAACVHAWRPVRQSTAKGAPLPQRPRPCSALARYIRGRRVTRRRRFTRRLQHAAPSVPRHSNGRNAASAARRWLASARGASEGAARIAPVSVCHVSSNHHHQKRQARLAHRV